MPDSKPVGCASICVLALYPLLIVTLRVASICRERIVRHVACYFACKR